MLFVVIKIGGRGRGCIVLFIAIDVFVPSVCVGLAVQLLFDAL
jgi:hypothetical protein